jgi:ABC-type multidrug transport system ATPase subunit
MNVLEADSIVVDYDGSAILRSVYIKCEQGEIVGLIGRNGSGKSTLLKVIFGSLSADHASVRINSTWVKCGYLKSRVTMLPQAGFTLPGMKLKDAVKLFDINEAKLLQSVPEIQPAWNSRFGEMSGGSRRFLETVLILHSPSLFCLLDEPFAGLAPVRIERLIDIMEKVKKDKGIILTDHQHRYLKMCVNKFYILNAGVVYCIQR